MRVQLPLMLLTLAAGPVLAQQHDPDHAVTGGGALPAGWQARTDGGRPMTNVKFEDMAPGWHLTVGPAVILYRDADKVDGLVHAVSKINLFPSSGHAEGFGLFLGGRNLQDSTQSYTYFLIRGDGMYLVKRRTGATTSTIVDWTASDAINKASAEGSVANEVSLQTGADSVKFMVNGKTVATLPASQVDTRGIVGLRVNHNLNLHIENLGVHPIGR
jgi:hypothetical protein